MQHLLAVCIGCAIGGAVYFGASPFLLRTAETKDVVGRDYIGYVVEHNPAEYTIRIAVASSYSSTLPPTDVRFTYDEATLWGVMNYGFEGETLVEKKTQTGKIDAVPAGALVKVTRNTESVGPLHAAAIVLFKRSTL